MKSALSTRLLMVVIATSLSLQAPIASAALVGTADAIASQPARSDRERVQDFLDRANVKERLIAMGVDAMLVGDRVDALSDEEVAVLAQKIDGMPAGGHLEKTDYIIILLIAILVAIIA